MINKVVLVGRITKDPEVRMTNSNVPVVMFTVAVNRQYKDENGNNVADFINCVAWRQQADFMSKYVKKGQQIGVEGRVQTRNYETPQGIRYVTEILAEQVYILEGKKDSGQQGYNMDSLEKSMSTQYGRARGEEPQEVNDDFGADFDVTDENLPF